MGGLLARLKEDKGPEKQATTKSTSAGAGVGVQNTASASMDRFKERIHSKLVDDMPSYIMAETDLDKKRALLKERTIATMEEEATKTNMNLTHFETQALISSILDDMIGFGPIQPLLGEEDISEVMVNGPDQVYYEAKGKLILSDIKFKEIGRASCRERV